MADLQVQKYLTEINDKVVESTRKLATVNSQLASRDREAKVCELTLSELNPILKEEKENKPATYRAVGKIFIKEDIATLAKELEDTRSKSLKDKETLEKAAAKLEVDIKDARRAFNEIVGKLQAQQQK